MYPVTVPDRISTILIVDDDLDLRILLTLVLGSQHMNVVTASGGQEALDILDHGEVPDLILTDMCMPGMNGSELFMKLKNNARTKNVPVIITSALENLEARTKTLGGEAYLQKPYRVDTLMDLVKTHLH